MNWFAFVTIGLVAARALAQLWLDAVNRRHVLAHASAVPAAFREIIDPDTYTRSVRYTLAKSELNRVEILYESVVLLVVLFSGLLPWWFGGFTQRFGISAWSMAACLWLVT